MKRHIEIESVQDADTGEVFFDRQHAERVLAFLLDTFEFFGGSATLVADRHQTGPEQYELRRVLVAYDSYAPARRLEEEPEPQELEAA